VFECVICSILDQQQKQTIPFAGGRCMGEFDGRVFVATSRDVYYLFAVPIEKQVSAESVNVSYFVPEYHSYLYIQSLLMPFLALVIF